jgi:fucose permease
VAELGALPRARVAARLVTSAAVVLALATVAVGVALGFAGQYQHFREHNPALLDRLEKRLSFC